MIGKPALATIGVVILVGCSPPAPNPHGVNRDET